MIDRIKRPTLLLNESICRSNIGFVKSKADRLNVQFRPHFKTHQSKEVSFWFREQNISKITVSSVKMAEYFQSCGWSDICIAFPLNVREINDINQLAQKADINILISSPECKNEIYRDLCDKVGVYIEIDAGHHRSGFSPEDLNILCDIVLKLSHKFCVKGILSHFGHTYTARCREDVIMIFKNSMKIMQRIKMRLQCLLPAIKISVGDTPGIMIIDDMPEVDEIRPGNFVFFDSMQVDIGSCSYSDIAVVLAVIVVAVYEARSEAVVYGGAVHLSKESLNDGSFGKVVLINEDLTWSGPVETASVKSLSQEHGIIHIGDKALLRQLKAGDLLGIIPVHSCLTVNLMKKYLCKDRYIHIMP